MMFVELLFRVPFLSLGIVLCSLSMITPKTNFSEPWQVCCFGAALPPLIVSISQVSALSEAAMILSGLVSAPFAAAMSLSVAVRLRRAA